MRKALCRTSAVYLAYIRGEIKVPDEVIRKIATAKPIFNSKLCLETHKNCDILMHDAKEKPTEFVAYFRT